MKIYALMLLGVLLGIMVPLFKLDDLAVQRSTKAPQWTRGRPFCLFFGLYCLVCAVVVLSLVVPQFLAQGLNYPVAIGCAIWLYATELVVRRLWRSLFWYPWCDLKKELLEALKMSGRDGMTVAEIRLAILKKLGISSDRFGFVLSTRGLLKAGESLESDKEILHLILPPEPGEVNPRYVFRLRTTP